MPSRPATGRPMPARLSCRQAISSRTRPTFCVVPIQADNPSHARSILPEPTIQPTPALARLSLPYRADFPVHPSPTRADYPPRACPDLANPIRQARSTQAAPCRLSGPVHADLPIRTIPDTPVPLLSGPSDDMPGHDRPAQAAPTSQVSPHHADIPNRAAPARPRLACPRPARPHHVDKPCRATSVRADSTYRSRARRAEPTHRPIPVPAHRPIPVPTSRVEPPLT